MRLSHFLVLIFCVSMSCSNKNQPKDNTVQSNKIGQIFFSKVDLTNTKDSEVDYINNFNLNKDEFLSIHFTLQQPLVKSLKELAPNLSDDELLSKGNFHFSFFVDGKLLYEENLNTGALRKLPKTEHLYHEIKFVTKEPIFFWGWLMWKRFLKLNSDPERLAIGKHTLSIEIKSYIKDDTVKVGGLLAKGVIDMEVHEITIDESLVPVQKIQANNDWEVSKDTFDRNKIEALNRNILEVAKSENVTINGVVVIKNNQLLIEEYFNGSSRDSLHDVRSVGKSFASSMMGIAIADGYIKSEDVLLKDFYSLKSFKNYSPKKDSVTLKSLLTMSSAFNGDDGDWDNPGNEENMYPTNDWVKFGLDLPMHKDKVIGQDYTYFTAGVVMLGDVIHKSVPDGLVSYADKKLFAPLNITNYKWKYTPQNVGSTAGGIQLRAIDFAKYGQLYKNKGKWKNKQIIDKDWVEKSLSKQVSQVYSGIEGGYYGYLFWNKVYTVNGRDYEVSFCTGNGGNKIFIFKDIPFVIVITASSYGMSIAHTTVDKMMINYILPAVTDKASK